MNLEPGVDRYLIYWQPGAWFHRELEDQGNFSGFFPVETFGGVYPKKPSSNTKVEQNALPGKTFTKTPPGKPSVPFFLRQL